MLSVLWDVDVSMGSDKTSPTYPEPTTTGGPGRRTIPRSMSTFSKPARSHSAVLVATETRGSGSKRGVGEVAAVKLGARGVSINTPVQFDDRGSDRTPTPMWGSECDAEPSDPTGVGPAGVGLADTAVREMAATLGVGLRDRTAVPLERSLSGSDDAIDRLRSSRSAASRRACLISLSSRRCLARTDAEGRVGASRSGFARVGRVYRSRLSRPREPE